MKGRPWGFPGEANRRGMARKLPGLR